MAWTATDAFDLDFEARACWCNLQAISTDVICTGQADATDGFYSPREKNNCSISLHTPKMLFLHDYNPPFLFFFHIMWWLFKIYLTQMDPAFYLRPSIKTRSELPFIVTDPHQINPNFIESWMGEQKLCGSQHGFRTWLKLGLVPDT